MEVINVPKMLIIAGTGRNSGKTTFACSVIRRFGTKVNIVSVKISPHRHPETGSLEPLLITGDLYIGEEKSRESLKDSSRMLAAGSRRSFIVMAHDDKLPDAWSFLFSVIDEHSMIVCESGGSGKYIKPGLFLMVHRAGDKVLKEESLKFRELCDRWIIFDGENFDFSPASIHIENNKWIIK